MGTAILVVAICLSVSFVVFAISGLAYLDCLIDLWSTKEPGPLLGWTAGLSFATTILLGIALTILSIINVST